MSEHADFNKLETKTLKLTDLKEYADNARVITDAAVDYVAWSIKETGYNEPIIVDADNVIVSGHVRKRALEKLGAEEVTVVVAKDLTPDQVDAFRLADNRIASMAIWDKEKLKDKFAGIADQFSIEKLGFDRAMFDIPQEVGSVFGTVDDGTGAGNGGDPGVKNTSEELDLDDFADDKFRYTCPHCGLKFN